LGGLALALDLMSKQMKVQNKSLSQFLVYYEENRKKLHERRQSGINDSYYDKGLDTVWRASFDSLTDKAKNMMCLLCFVAPDAIPQTLFKKSVDAPGGFDFLGDLDL
jgi:hypothetical protein